MNSTTPAHGKAVPSNAAPSNAAPSDAVLRDAVLRVAGLTVTRPSRAGARSSAPATVVDAVSFDVAPGECLAIVGSSGAGKSVLSRSLLGLAGAGAAGWHTSAATFTLAGHDMRDASERTWRARRGSDVALVLQDALQSLDPLRTIEAEVSEALAIRGVPRRERRAAAIASLGAAGLPEPESLLGLQSTALSGGMRQRALIAAALVGDPAVLVADEPTTALDPATASQVLDEFGRLRDSGMALVVVSHDLGAVARIADRIAVLEHGRIVELGPASRLLQEPTHAATRALVEAIPRPLASEPLASEPPASEPRNAAQQPAEPLAVFEGVTRGFGMRGDTFTGVRDIDLEVHRGEILGIAGVSGAGKTTLARILAGAESPTSGRFELAPNTRVRLIPQDPLATFDPRWRVRRILEATIRRAYPAGDGPTPEALMARVGLSAGLLPRRPVTLSGGERQRVAIARALAARPDILVCDEAVSALDTVTQAGVLALLRELRNDAAIVFVTHDLGALSSLSDRAVVMREGRIVDDAEASAFFA